MGMASAGVSAAAVVAEGGADSNIAPSVAIGERQHSLTALRLLFLVNPVDEMPSYLNQPNQPAQGTGNSGNGDKEASSGAGNAGVQVQEGLERVVSSRDDER